MHIIYLSKQESLDFIKRTQKNLITNIILILNYIYSSMTIVFYHLDDFVLFHSIFYSAVICYVTMIMYYPVPSIV